MSRFFYIEYHISKFIDCSHCIKGHFLCGSTGSQVKCSSSTCALSVSWVIYENPFSVELPHGHHHPFHHFFTYVSDFTFSKFQICRVFPMPAVNIRYFLHLHLCPTLTLFLAIWFSFTLWHFHLCWETIFLMTNFCLWSHSFVTGVKETTFFHVWTWTE